MSLPKRHGRLQGYAFVTLENESELEKASEKVNGKEVDGRELRVQKATSGGPYPTTGTQERPKRRKVRIQSY